MITVKRGLILTSEQEHKISSTALNTLIGKANAILEDAELLHRIRCETVDLELQSLYEEQIRRYSYTMQIIKLVAPEYIQEFGGKVMAEAKNLEEEIGLLVDEPWAGDHLTEIVARHIRLLDQATALA